MSSTSPAVYRSRALCVGKAPQSPGFRNTEHWLASDVRSAAQTVRVRARVRDSFL